MSLTERQDIDRPSPPFLGLPQELWEEIYRELLSENLVYGFPKYLLKLQPAILRVNKQINEEAYPILYDENCWVVLEMNCEPSYIRKLRVEYCPLISPTHEHLEKFPRKTFLHVKLKKVVPNWNPTTLVLRRFHIGEGFASTSRLSQLLILWK